MEQFKRVKVVMLPTNEKVVNTKEYQLLLSNSLFWTSKIEIERYTEGWFFLKNSSSYNSCAITIPNVENFKHQHLYIISDDEIKEGDWCINTGGEIKDSFPFKVTKEVMSNKFIKKIIATTDSSLCYLIKRTERGSIEQRLPQPSQQFIEKYIEEYNKGNIITNVLVEYEEWCNCNGSIKMRKHLRTTKCDKCIEWEELKINPKDNTITIKKVKDSWNREEVVQLLIDCCAEISSIHGKLKGKEPADLYKWIEENL